MPRAILLFSGSLDSQLAACLLRAAGVELAALFVRTPWKCGAHQARAAAERLALPLTEVEVAADYCDPLVEIARRGVRPTQFCADCHQSLARCARERLEAVGADFVASGHVLGQKASNQKRRDYDRYAYHSGLGDRLLWPLSAQHLAVTWPERQGWLDRQHLGDLSGRGRTQVNRLAQQYGLPPDSRGPTGCPLGQTGEFGRQVVAHVARGGSRAAAEFELLRLGHQLSVAGDTRVHLGRRQAENEALVLLWRSAALEAVLLEPVDFAGPTAIVAGRPTARALDLAITALVRYAKLPPHAAWTVQVSERSGPPRRIAGAEQDDRPDLSRH